MPEIDNQFDPILKSDVYITRFRSPIPAELVRDFLSKLHYVSSDIMHFELTQERDAVHFQSANSESSSTIAARIAQIADKMCATYRPQEPKVLVTHNHPVTFEADPQPLLAATGELITFGPGRVALGPRLVALMNYFDSRIVEMARSIGATNFQFPTLIRADVLARCMYLRSFPHSLSLVSHLETDLESIQKFARTARWDGQKLIHDEAEIVTECLLSPTVCFHCYASLQDTKQSDPKVITACGRCYRYESGNLGGLERLWDFTMREIIFIGSADFVLNGREKLIAESAKLLDEWRLSFEIKRATDAFFVDQNSIASFQAAFDLKYEAQAVLPYSGGTTAVGSFNFHQDMFGRSLNITNAEGSPVNTGCVGFGLERLVLAFLAQHGLDRHNWPERVTANITN